MADVWCEPLCGLRKDSVYRCFWCQARVKRITRDHLIPLGMGGASSGKTVDACQKCNSERGKVTELYSDRHHMLKYIERNPERITTYKNRFRRKVQKMLVLIAKWDKLHREKDVVLPYNIFEVIHLDDLMPFVPYAQVVKLADTPA